LVFADDWSCTGYGGWVRTKTVKAGAFCKEHDGELEVTRRIEYGESIESMKLNTMSHKGSLFMLYTKEIPLISTERIDQTDRADH
jgi:hypothetical protein